MRWIARHARVAAAALLLAVAPGAARAQAVSQLPAATSVNLGDLVPVTQGYMGTPGTGTTRRVTIQQIVSLASGGASLTPTGVAAGPCAKPTVTLLGLVQACSALSLSDLPAGVVPVGLATPTAAGLLLGPTTGAFTIDGSGLPHITFGTTAGTVADGGALAAAQALGTSTAAALSSETTRATTAEAANATAASAAQATASAAVPLSGAAAMTGALRAPVVQPQQPAMRPPTAPDAAPYQPAGAISSIPQTSYGVAITTCTVSIAPPPTGVGNRQATAVGIVIPANASVGLVGTCNAQVTDPGAGYTINTYPAVTITDNGTTHAAAGNGATVTPTNGFWVSPSGMQYTAAGNQPGDAGWLPTPPTAPRVVDATGIQPAALYASSVQVANYPGPLFNFQAGLASQDIGFGADGRLDYAALDAFYAANVLSANKNTVMAAAADPRSPSVSGCTSGIYQLAGGTQAAPAAQVMLNAGAGTYAVVDPGSYSFYPPPGSGLTGGPAACPGTVDVTTAFRQAGLYPTINKAYDQTMLWSATSISIVSGGTGCVSYGTANIVNAGLNNPITGGVTTLAITATGGVVTAASIVTAGAYASPPSTGALPLGGAVLPPGTAYVTLNSNHEPGCTATLKMAFAQSPAHDDAIAGWQLTNQIPLTIAGHLGTTCTTTTGNGAPISGGTVGTGGTYPTLDIVASSGAVTSVSIDFSGLMLVPPPNPVFVAGCDAPIFLGGWQTSGPSMTPSNTIGPDRAIVFDPSEGVFGTASNGYPPPLFRKALFLPTAVAISTRAGAIWTLARVMTGGRFQSFAQLGPSTGPILWGTNSTPQEYISGGGFTALGNGLPSQTPQVLGGFLAGNDCFVRNDDYGCAPGPATGTVVNGGVIGYSDSNYQADVAAGASNPKYTTDSSAWEASIISLWGGGGLVNANQSAIRQAMYQRGGINPQNHDLLVIMGPSNLSGHDQINDLSTPRLLEPLLTRPYEIVNTAVAGATIAAEVGWIPTQVAPLLQNRAGARVVCFLSGASNDFEGGSISASAAHALLVTGLQTLRSIGCTRVVDSTQFASNGFYQDYIANSGVVGGGAYTGTTGLWYQWRNVYNPLIRGDVAAGYADATVDEAASQIVGDCLTCVLNTQGQWYYGDAAHLTPAGQALILPLNASVINGLP